MSDVAQQVSLVASQVAAINVELDTLQAEIDSLVSKRLQLRIQRESLSKVLASKQVEQRVADHESAAAAARADAEKQTAELAEKNKRADELLAKLEAQAAAAEVKS